MSDAREPETALAATGADSSLEGEKAVTGPVEIAREAAIAAVAGGRGLSLKQAESLQRLIASYTAQIEAQKSSINRLLEHVKFHCPEYSNKLADLFARCEYEESRKGNDV